MKKYSKQVYTYKSAKDVISQRMKKFYGYEVESSLRDIEEYDMWGEIPTITTQQEMDTNTRKTSHIGIYIIYQTEINKYTKRIIEFKNLYKYYTIIWEFCNKQFQIRLRWM